ncbi:hypothetical protein EG68_10570 [Paragonimus skrjabini miyazakii]|uniref:Bifunctional polynucleotide phosphatase/kinase n=1 Tax=Paragonimus skrjabini miyazakii TaxID=59628 RepID=A0A8S9YF79_9TREM|nr:hypothetical protein EG68_10570 [Paragonimus skrjabini miyazakii]
MPVKRKSDSSCPDFEAKRKMVQTTLNNCTTYSTLSQQQSSGGHWQVTNSLLIYTPSDLKPSSKVLALDLDGTIITTASGKTFPKDNNDWKLLNNRICQTLRDYSANGFKLVIISNQRGITKGYQDVPSFQKKAENIVHALALPVQCYFSIVSDLNRKPLTGMWEELERNGNEGVTIDRSASFYCGDAAGRPAEGTRKKDHACSDRLFALNLGVPFLTPEQLWFGRTESGVFSMPQFDPTSLLTCPASLPLLERPKCTELILLVGYPASGKSRFAQKYLAPLGYTIISRVRSVVFHPVALCF